MTLTSAFLSYGLSAVSGTAGFHAIVDLTVTLKLSYHMPAAYLHKNRTFCGLVKNDFYVIINE